MNSNSARFAPLGLLIAAISLLTAIGLYIVHREINIYVQASLVMVFVGLGIFEILNPRRIRALFRGRRAGHWSNVIILGVAFIGFLIAINYLAYSNPVRWDYTEIGKFTLMDETLETIDQLPGKVSIFGFYTPEYSTEQVGTLLDQYKLRSDGKIEYTLIDETKDPLTAEKYNNPPPGTLVLVLGDHQEQVRLVEEREITSALVRLISPGERKVYFLTGHGEYDPEGMNADSYSEVKRVLETKNYVVEKVNIASEGEIPQDGQVLVIAGPQIPLIQAEVDLLDEYLNGGGAMIIMEEPLPMTDFGDSPDPLADYLTVQWGITLGEDMVVDPNSSQPLAPFAGQYGDHLITERLQSIATVYPTARSVTIDNSVSSARLQDLVMTSANAWAESDLQALTETSDSGDPPSIQPDAGVDILGPVTLAVTLEDTAKQTRMVVFGDSDFAADNYFYEFGNGDILINSVDWVSKQETIINLTPKEDIPRVLIPPAKITLNLIFIASVILLPGLILVAGVIVWVQRRRRG